MELVRSQAPYLRLHGKRGSLMEITWRGFVTNVLFGFLFQAPNEEIRCCGTDMHINVIFIINQKQPERKNDGVDRNWEILVI